MDCVESIPLATWIWLHLGGVFAAAVSRLTVGSIARVVLRSVTVIGFAAVAAVAFQSLLAGGDQCRLSLVSAFALMAMVLAVVTETRNAGVDPHLSRFVTADDRPFV